MLIVVLLKARSRAILCAEQSMRKCFTVRGVSSSQSSHVGGVRLPARRYPWVRRVCPIPQAGEGSFPLAVITRDSGYGRNAVSYLPEFVRGVLIPALCPYIFHLAFDLGFCVIPH